MSVSIGDALLKLNVDSSGLDSGMKTATTSIQKSAKIMGTAMVAMGGAIIGALTLAMKAAAEEEAGIIKLSMAMKNVGLSYDSARKSLEVWIDAEQQKTAVADDEQRSALATLLLYTNDLTKAQDLLTLAMDIAAGTGRDLAGVTGTLGYAIAGNWGMVNRMIPALAAVESEEAKWMMLRQMFMGQAEAYGRTMSGQMKVMQANIGDLKEAIGGFVAEAASPFIARLNDIIRDLKATNPEMMRLATRATLVSGGFLAVGGTFLLLLSQLPNILLGFRTLNTTLTATRTLAFGIQTSINRMMLAILALGYAVIYVDAAIQKQALPTFNDMGDTLKNRLAPVMDWINGLMGIGDAAGSLVPGIDGLGGAIGDMTDDVDAQTKALKEMREELMRIESQAVKTWTTMDELVDISNWAAEYMFAHPEVTLGGTPEFIRATMGAMGGMLSPFKAGEGVTTMSNSSSPVPQSIHVHVNIDGRQAAEAIVNPLGEMLSSRQQVEGK